MERKQIFIIIGGLVFLGILVFGIVSLVTTTTPTTTPDMPNTLTAFASRTDPDKRRSDIDYIDPCILDPTGEKHKECAFRDKGSSVDCVKFPDAPACQKLPDIAPTITELQSCLPPNGEAWSIKNAGIQERSRLNSPCCQPPEYKSDNPSSRPPGWKPYSMATGNKTCDSNLDTSNDTDACLSKCCNYVNEQAPAMDSSWYALAKCGCSLYCNNKEYCHFKKYGSPINYLQGQLADAKTSDDCRDVITGSGQ